MHCYYLSSFLLLVLMFFLISDGQHGERHCAGAINSNLLTRSCSDSSVSMGHFRTNASHFCRRRTLVSSSQMCPIAAQTGAY